MEHLLKQQTIKLTKSEVLELISDENLLAFNREINHLHVARMKKSIESLGVLRFPVLARLNYSECELAIADMQHGLCAISEIMGDDDTIEAIVKDCEDKREVVDLVSKLNTTSKGWNDEDFLNCWIEFGSDNANYGNYITLKDRLVKTGLSIGLLISIYTSNKNKFKSGGLEFDNADKSLFISNFCSYFRSQLGFKSFQLSGLVRFLLDNNLTNREAETFRRRIIKLDEENKLPKHRDDFRDLLCVIAFETSKEFNSRFIN